MKAGQTELKVGTRVQLQIINDFSPSNQNP